MKSVVYALACLPSALAAAIGMLLAPITTSRENLMYLYGLLGVASLLTSLIFYLTFGHYDTTDKEYLRVDDKVNEELYDL